jgi:hypothetical protein
MFRHTILVRELSQFTLYGMLTSNRQGAGMSRAGCLIERVSDASHYLCIASEVKHA